MPTEISYADLLIKGLESGDIPFRDPVLADIRKWRAFRENDKAYLQNLVTWNAERRYRVDPLPKRMSLAFADFMFGEDPVTRPVVEDDLQVHNDLLQNNQFTDKCHQGADICVTEGKVFWRIYVNEEESGWPILKYHSRAEVIPYYIGERLVALGFITTYKPKKTGDPGYRHLEVHEKGRVVNLLYEYKEESSGGTQKTSSERQTINNSDLEKAGSGDEKIGTKVALTRFPATQNVMDEWSHDLPMLAGEIPNGEDAKSIYDGLEDFFLDLNEAHTVDAENFRLAGKKRASIPKKYADSIGQMDAGEEIIWTDTENEIDPDDVPIKIFEYSYDGGSSVARKDDLEQRALTRVGLARQLVDANANEGLAQTGTALRTRLLPTTAALKGKNKKFQEKLPIQIDLLQQVDAKEFSREYKSYSSEDNIGKLPSVTIASPLPVDAQEEATRHQTLVTSELESLETAVEELHPGWSKTRRDLEVRRILANRAGYALDDEGNAIRVEGVANPDQPDRTDRTSPEPAPEEPAPTPEGGGATPPNRQGT